MTLFGWKTPRVWGAAIYKLSVFNLAITRRFTSETHCKEPVRQSRCDGSIASTSLLLPHSWAWQMHSRRNSPIPSFLASTQTPAAPSSPPNRPSTVLHQASMPSPASRSTPAKISRPGVSLVRFPRIFHFSFRFVFAQTPTCELPAPSAH